MQRVKQRSIQNSIFRMMFFFGLCIVTIIISMIYLLSEQLIEMDIKTYIGNEVYEKGKSVRIKNGELLIENEFYDETDEIYFLVLNKEHHVYAGTYPEELEGVDVETLLAERSERIRGRMQTFEYNGESYYLVDKKKSVISRDLDEDIFVRGMVRKKDISSDYQTIRNACYLGVLGIVAIAVVFTYLFTKKLMKPLHRPESVKFVLN